MTDPVSVGIEGPVAVIGTGLLGTSVALACRRAGLEVLLSDASADNLRTASGLGAGRRLGEGDRPALVVVAVPPQHLATVVAEALRQHPDAVVTDVGSVKSAPLAGLQTTLAPEELARYVGSHPMAGSERSGPLASSAMLFDGRPWAVTPHATSRPDAVEVVTSLARLCGAVVVEMSPEEHDQAVARTSHLPHLAAVLVAGALTRAPAGQLELSGQGVRDVTRVAASDPALWQQILRANSEAVVGLLAEVRDALDDLMDAVAEPASPRLGEILALGNAGTAAIPGKHGGPARAMAALFVAVSDTPGELARLFGDAGEIGVNIEDVRIDHDPGRPGGQVELVVEATSLGHLAAALESRGWLVHG
jgi:prephenate dehydrogenase